MLSLLLSLFLTFARADLQAQIDKWNQVIWPALNGGGPDGSWTTACGAGLACNANIYEVLLSGQGLSGTIHPDIATLTGLKTLSLFINSLHHTLPPLPASLETLNVFSNELSGPLPSMDGLSMPALHTVYLYSNRFSGPLDLELPAISGGCVIVLLPGMNNEYSCFNNCGAGDKLNQACNVTSQDPCQQPWASTCTAYVPTLPPTRAPTRSPSTSPTPAPSNAPSTTPSPAPSTAPSPSPSPAPSAVPPPPTTTTTTTTVPPGTQTSSEVAAASEPPFFASTAGLIVVAGAGAVLLMLLVLAVTCFASSRRRRRRVRRSPRTSSRRGSHRASRHPSATYGKLELSGRESREYFNAGGATSDSSREYMNVDGGGGGGGTFTPAYAPAPIGGGTGGGYAAASPLSDDNAKPPGPIDSVYASAPYAPSAAGGDSASTAVYTSPSTYGSLQ